MSLKIPYRDERGFITKINVGKRKQDYVNELVKKSLFYYGCLSPALRYVACPETKGLICKDHCLACKKHGEEDFENVQFTCNSLSRFSFPVDYRQTKIHSITWILEK